MPIGKPNTKEKPPQKTPTWTDRLCTVHRPPAVVVTPPEGRCSHHSGFLPTNTMIKKTKMKTHLGTGSAGLAARRPCGLTAPHGPGYGARLPDEAMAGIGYHGLYWAKGLEGGKKTGQRWRIFVLVTFYWHHVRLFTEELGPHPRM